MLKIIKHHIILICCFVGLILSPHEIYAASITLAWVPGKVQPFADVAGYMIYYGTQSGNYTYPPIDVGNRTSYTINENEIINFDENQTYYFEVTAYASAFEESKPSSEVSTFNEFTGTAKVRKKPWGSCEKEERPGDNVEDVEVRISFNFLPTQDLPTQGRFMFEPEDPQITCNEGTFIQRDDDTIAAECVKKGRWGIITFYNFIFEGSGNASLRDPLTLNATGFNVFNCPVYVIEMKDLLPVQE